MGRPVNARGAVSVTLVAVIAACTVGAGAGIAVGVAGDDSTPPATARTVSVARVAISRCPAGAAIGTLQSNDRVYVTGRDTASQFLQLRDPRNLDERVWVVASAVHGDADVKKVRVASCPRGQEPTTTTITTSTSTTTTTVPGASTTTVPGATTTTVRGVAPPVTQPPATNAPVTNPPVTNAPDTTDPAIGGITANPGLIYEHDTVVCPGHAYSSSVSASVTDAGGLASVTARWSVTGHSGTSSTGQAGNVYSATIGPFPTSYVPYPTASAPVSITMRAVDKAGNVTEKSTKITLVDCTFI